jgi:hypothetical protein
MACLAFLPPAVLGPLGGATSTWRGATLPITRFLSALLISSAAFKPSSALCVYTSPERSGAGELAPLAGVFAALLSSMGFCFPLCEIHFSVSQR